MSLGFLDLPGEGLDPVEASSRVAKNITAAIDELKDRGIVDYLAMSGSEEEFDARLATKGCLEAVASVAEKHLKDVEDATSVLIKQLRSANSNAYELPSGCEKCGKNSFHMKSIGGALASVCTDCGTPSKALGQTKTVEVPVDAYREANDKTAAHFDPETGKWVSPMMRSLDQFHKDNSEAADRREKHLDEMAALVRGDAEKEDKEARVAFNPTMDVKDLMPGRCTFVSEDGTQCGEDATQEGGFHRCDKHNQKAAVANAEPKRVEAIECPECDGKGGTPCTNCNGTGRCTECDDEGCDSDYVDAEDGKGPCGHNYDPWEEIGCNGTGQWECENCNGAGILRA